MWLDCIQPPELTASSAYESIAPASETPIGSQSAEESIDLIKKNRLLHKENHQQQQLIQTLVEKHNLVQR